MKNFYAAYCAPVITEYMQMENPEHVWYLPKKCGAGTVISGKLKSERILFRQIPQENNHEQ